MGGGSLIISLDFELFWGMRDKASLASYGSHILGVRQAIPAMLDLFRRYQIHATWAAVGLLLFDNKHELKRYLPARLPSYQHAELSPYAHLEAIGPNERADPYHYGLSLIHRILSFEGMELASHTFSHYYSLEPGQTAEQFRDDMEASAAAISRLGVSPRSIVFPRNQYNSESVRVCSDLGFSAFRGNQASWMYRAAPDVGERSKVRRAAQLLDAYCNFAGNYSFLPELESGLVNLPASRFLRPWERRRRLLEPCRLKRICGAMTEAARCGACFHLWWHPHNFGVRLAENLAFLHRILGHFETLRERFGMQSKNMSELAPRAKSKEAA